MIITSKDNEIIKNIKKLKEKKYRLDTYIVEGIKMVKEAISENQEIELIAIREDFKIDFDTKKIKIVTISNKIFNDISDVKTPQGILAVIKKNQNNQIETNSDYILALDSLQDPGNMGTIIRTADSANINQIIINKTTVDPYSPKVIRSTMGAIYRTNIIEVEDLKATLKEMKLKGFQIITTDLKATQSIYDINYNNKTVVVIGNEANGVSQEILQTADKKVIIPMLGKTESLNASIAASIMIYEYVRQKIQKS
ncbi:MAG: RNA methyltransferase [Clostridiales bacterium]|nr:RNA methyltransferase [Clostridiales bacterium]